MVLLGGLRTSGRDCCSRSMRRQYTALHGIGSDDACMQCFAACRHRSRGRWCMRRHFHDKPTSFGRIMKANHPRLLLRASTGVGICTAAIPPGSARPLPPTPCSSTARFWRARASSGFRSLRMGGTASVYSDTDPTCTSGKYPAGTGASTREVAPYAWWQCGHRRPAELGAVPIIPAGSDRRIDAPDPGFCPF
jgi:hypothetical protein